MTQADNRTLIDKVPLSQQLNKTETSLLKSYQDKVLGTHSLSALIGYELATLLFSNLSGGLGYVLRKRFYPKLFKRVGSSAIFGKGVVLRHPGKITLGDRVAIDDYTLLDANCPGDAIVSIGDNVIISRNCVIQSKSGPIEIGDKTDIGCNTILSACSGITIGKSVLIAGNCYIGGGRYVADRLDIPMMEQGIYSIGKVVIKDGAWLGAGATVLDGIQVGEGCIVGAGAVVTKDLPDYAIAVGTPAKVIKMRSPK